MQGLPPPVLVRAAFISSGTSVYVGPPASLPSDSPLPRSEGSSSSYRSLSGGQIAGIVVGCIAGGAVIIGGAALAYMSYFGTGEQCVFVKYKDYFHL